MARNWKLGLIAVIAVAAIGGIGFSQFTSTATITGNASAGNIDLQWTPQGTPAMVATSSWDDCSAVVTASTITITAYNLAPGDDCQLPSSDGVTLTNFGTIPASVTWSVTDSAPACFGGDNSLPGAIPYTIGPGQSLPAGGIQIDMYMYSGVGNSCQNVTGSIVFTEAGVAGV